MSGLPLLSIITWSPFVAALVIMAVARHRPRLVRSTAVLGAAVPLEAAAKPLTAVEFDLTDPLPAAARAG